MSPSSFADQLIVNILSTSFRHAGEILESTWSYSTVQYSTITIAGIYAPCLASSLSGEETNDVQGLDQTTFLSVQGHFAQLNIDLSIHFKLPRRH